MTEPGPRTPLRRPAGARPRTDRADDAPPSLDELAAIERQLAALPVYSGATVAAADALGADLVSHPGRGPAQNFVAAVRWPEEEMAERIGRVAAHFRAAGEWPAMLVADGMPGTQALAQHLQAAGWTAVESERVMWTRRPPVVPHLDPSTRLEATTRRSAGDHERLEREVFGLAPAHAAERVERLAEAVESGALRAFVVRLHGEVVAVARLALAENVAAIYGVGVAARWRRQGYGALVTAIATRSGLAAGDRLVWLSVSEANEPALRLYRSLGYQPAFAWTRWLAPSP